MNNKKRRKRNSTRGKEWRNKRRKNKNKASSSSGNQAKISWKQKSKKKNKDFHKELLLIVGELKNIKSKQQNLEKDFALYKWIWINK